MEVSDYKACTLAGAAKYSFTLNKTITKVFMIHMIEKQMFGFLVRLPDEDLLFANDSQEEGAMIRQVNRYY